MPVAIQDSELGSYDREPVAIVVGAWYTEQMIKDFQEAAVEEKKVWWLKVEKDIKTQELKPGETYAQVTAIKIKKMMVKLLNNGDEATKEVIVV